jgi:hypothetical protein
VGQASFKRFDTLFRNVVSVSNKVVREKMADEKRERTPRGPKPKTKPR